MPAARRLALLAVIAVIAALVAVPAVASAQTTTVPQLTPTVTTPKQKAAKPSSSKAQLPNTGVDARVLAAVGIALLLCGVGLRMRSADEHF